MNYYPKHKSCDELLVLTGFNRAGMGMGWEKVHSNFPKDHRLHAFAHHGFIQLHYDVKGGPNGHIGKSFHAQVKKTIKEFEEKDESKWSLKAILNSFKHGHQKEKA